MERNDGTKAFRAAPGDDDAAQDAPTREGRRAPCWQWILLAVALAYIAAGWLPIVPVEGDDLAIAAGAHELALQHHFERVASYRYDVQSGTYWLVSPP